MWIITTYKNNSIKMLEFEKEEEAREVFKSIQDNKILTEVIYFNDPCFAYA